MKNENYITIQGWMINKLGLSGNELLCYALIYGFSQDGESCFCGSRKYISELIGAKSLNTVDKYLDILIGKQLIEKRSCVNNGVISNYYKANLGNQFFLGCTPPSKNEYPLSKNEHNNINIDNVKEKEIDKSISKKDELFEQCWLNYRRKGSKKKSLEQWKKLSNEEKEQTKKHILAYIESVSDVKYQKDFERYLRDKCFLNVVYKDGRTIFDTETNDEPQKDDKLIVNGVIYR